MGKKLKITCESDDFLPYDSISDFQGNLKYRDDSDYDHLIQSMVEHGFSFPFFVWKHTKYEDGEHVVYDCLDGHGRLEALRRMEKQGYEIPPLPVTYVDCEGEEEAKQALIYVNSLSGKYTATGLQDFVSNMPTFDASKYHFAGVDMAEIQKKLEKIAETNQFIQSVQPEEPVAYSPPVPAPPPSSLVPSPFNDKQQKSVELVSGAGEGAIDLPTMEEQEIVVICQHCGEAFKHHVF
jgi:hypothetical protein